MPIAWLDEARCSDPSAKGDFSEWATRFLRIDRVLRAKNPDVNVQDVLAQVDLAQCPGTRLWLAAREMRIRAGGLAKPNDVDDWVFVPVVPYCDVVLTDKAHREAIVQGDRLLCDRVFADPAEALKAIDRILR